MSKTRKMSVSKAAKKPEVVQDAAMKDFIRTVEKMRRANTASPEIARSKLKELGILTSDGRLSDKYK